MSNRTKPSWWLRRRKLPSTSPPLPPAPWPASVSRLAAVVPVATVIAYILKQGETLADLPGSAVPAAPVPAAAVPAAPAPALPASQAPTVPPPVAQPATPIAARIAKEHGLDLAQVPAAGDRIRREDVERFLASRQPASPQQNQPAIRQELRPRPPRAAWHVRVGHPP